MTSPLVHSDAARSLRRIRRVSTAGVVGLAAAGFTMSYGALHSLAEDSGVPPGLAWLWPLVVDGFILVASLSVLHAVLEARRVGYPWLLLLGFSAVSVAGNVAHGAPTAVGRLVAAVPPVALVLAFDLLMRQVHRALDPATPADETAVPTLVPAHPRAIAETSHEAAAEPTPVRGARPTVAGQAARVVARRRASGGVVTGGWLGAELGISTGYARRLLRQLDQPTGIDSHSAGDQAPVADDAPGHGLRPVASQRRVNGVARPVGVGGSR